MRFTILYTLASAALLLQPIITGVMPRELVQRDCPSGEYDPAGRMCSTNSDCTDPCFPICVCGAWVIGTGVGEPTTYIYYCAKDQSGNIC